MFYDKIHINSCNSLNSSLDIAIDNYVRDVIIFSDFQSMFQSLFSIKINVEINTNISQIKKKLNTAVK